MAKTCGNCGQSVEDHEPEETQCKCLIRIREIEPESKTMTAEEFLKSKFDFGMIGYDHALEALGMKEREHQEKLREIREEIMRILRNDDDIDVNIYVRVSAILDKAINDKK